MKYVKLFIERFSSRPVFTISDVKLFLSSLSAPKGYAYLLVSNFLKTHRIKKLKRGVYTFASDPTLASLAFTPSYHGLQEALSLHNLWEQETNTVIITPRKVRQGARQMLESRVIVHRIARKMFFGFETRKYHDMWINVSDIEKTLIDFSYFREPLDNNTIREIRKRIDKKKLASYLKKCPVRVKRKIRKLFRQKI